MSSQQRSLVRRADAFEEVTGALRPRRGRSPCRNGQEIRIDALCEIGEHRRHLTQSAGAFLVTNKIDRRGLDSGNQDRSARRVEALVENFYNIIPMKHRML